MDSLIDELKAHARVLHRQAQAGDPETLTRFRTLTPLRALDDAALATTVRRRHGLALVAADLGFRGWSHALSVLRGEETEDFGDLLCPPGADVFWNVWSASYEEARSIRQENDGYLLAYRRHFFIADRNYPEFLGAPADDEDWEAIGRDWARPADPAARQRLYARIIRYRLARERRTSAGRP